MRNSFQFCRWGLPLMALIFPVISAFGAERDELALSLKLIDQLQASAERARVVSVQDEAHARYFFDYARLQSDLQTLRAGIERYLTPGRAQPRDAGVIDGAYRREKRGCQ